MRRKSGPAREPAEQVVKDIRRATRRHFSAEEKIRIVAAARGVSIDVLACAEIAVEGEMRQKCVKLLANLALRDMSVLPASQPANSIRSWRLSRAEI